MKEIWRLLAGVPIERTWARFRTLGLTIGLVVGVMLVTVGLVGTWHDGGRHLAQTVEIAPGTVSDGHLTIRLQSGTPGR